MTDGDAFLAAYRLTPGSQSGGDPVDGELGRQAAGFDELMGRLGGRTFEDGLYRAHDAASATVAQGLVRTAFPDHVGRVQPFGYDWLGSQFCLDDARRDDGEPLVVILEVGTGEALQVPCGFAAFHDVELVEQADAAVGRSFFEEWRAQVDPAVLPLRRDQCVGYRIPLFLGGKDAVENLEVSDLEVYWEVTGQSLRALR